MKTAKDHALELLEDWLSGTDAREQLPEWMWKDFLEKAEVAFNKATEEALHEQD